MWDDGCSVVGGVALLRDMEFVETGKHDKPQQDITINSTAVFQDPYEEVRLRWHHNALRDGNDLFGML